MGVNQISSGEFEKFVLNNNGVVLVEFFGTWCMPCKMLSGVLDQVAEKFNGQAEIVKLDLDENEELAKQYGVMTVPTLIVFKNGAECEKSVGFRNINQITQMIEKYIEIK